MDIPPALLQLGVPGTSALLLWWALAKGWLITQREADDIRAQRDAANSRSQTLLEINSQLSAAALESARKDALSVQAVQAIRRKAEEPS